MAVSINQFALTNGSATSMVSVNAGETAYVSSVTAAGTVYVGTSSTVTSSTGFPIVTGNPPLPIPVPLSSAPVTLYGIGSGSVNAAVLVISR